MHICKHLLPHTELTDASVPVAPLYTHISETDTKPGIKSTLTTILTVKLVSCVDGGNKPLPPLSTILWCSDRTLCQAEAIFSFIQREEEQAARNFG